MRLKILAVIAFFCFLNSAAMCSQAIEQPVNSSIFVTIDDNNKIGEFDSNKLVFRDGSAASSCSVLKMSVNSFPAEALASLSGRPVFIHFEIPEKPADFDSFSKEALQNIKKAVFSLKAAQLKGILFDMSPDTAGSQWEEDINECTKLYCMLAREIKNYDSKILVGGMGFNYVFDGESEGNFKEVAPYITYFLDFTSRVGVPCNFLYIKSPALVPYGYFSRISFLKKNVVSAYDPQPLIYASIAVEAQDCSSEFLNVSALQAFICAVKARADFIELKSGERLPQFFSQLDDTPVQLDTEGLDRLAFIAMAAKSKDNSKYYIAVASANPSSWLLSDEANVCKQMFETEYRSYVHRFTDGLFPPAYNRFRISFSNMPWAGKTVRMKRFSVAKDNKMELIEERDFDGMKDFFINKEIACPQIMIITFENIVPESNEEKSE